MIYSPSVPQPIDIQEWDVLPIDTVTLSDTDLEGALQVSRSIPTLERQWLAYRHALALAGFRQWLGARSPHCTLHAKTCSLYQPAIASFIESVCQLWVNKIRVCLVALGSVSDTIVSIPRAVLEFPDYAAQVYILLEVLEEHQQVRVVGYSPYPQIVSRISEGIESAPMAWTYDIDQTTFIQDVDRLLLLLEGLDPRSVVLPQALPVREEAIATLSQRLNQLWPQLRDPEMPLEQVLSWPEFAILLQCVDQRNWLYQLQMGREPFLSPLFQAEGQAEGQEIRQETEPPEPSLPQPIINVGQWLQNRLDQVAQDMAWVLMPPLSSEMASSLAAPLSPAFAGLRSPLVDNFETVVASLNADGIAIDPQVRGAYRDITHDDVALRLYAMTWPLEMNEWVLLLVLGTVPGTPTPEAMRLMVYDQHQCLADRQLATTESDGYVYAQVVGDRNESFWVVINSGVGHPIALPPFSFADSSSVS